MGTLYVVATPIGNLEDTSPRARRVLAEVDLIAAEDTRRTGLLMQRFGISTPVISYHAFNEQMRVNRLLDVLASGDVALVSDAGTPGISDPGQLLVQAASNHGFDVVAIPGPSGMAAAVSISGLVEGPFLFLGFLPRKGKERRNLLRTAFETGFALVLYESPNRIGQTLRDLSARDPNRDVALCREMTKLHEEVVRGTLDQVAGELTGRTWKGELVIVVSRGPPAGSADDPADRLTALLDSGFSVNDAAREVASISNVPKSELYQLALTIQRSLQSEETEAKSGRLKGELAMVEQDALQNTDADEERPQ